MKKILGWIAFGAAFSAMGSAPSILYNFDGKGTGVSFDFGVTRELFAHLKRGVVPKMYFSGSSSGSIAATHFACHGLTPEAFTIIEKTMEKFSQEIINEDPGAILRNLFLGKPPESSLDKVKPVLDAVTDNRTCLPTIPLLVVAANSEVDGRKMNADRTKWEGAPFAGKTDKKLDRSTLEVRDAQGQLVAKACTYFVNAPMYEIIKLVDEKERLCDVVVMTTPEQVYRGVLASIKEPTYYLEEPEKEPQNILSIAPPKAPRSYIGGWVLNAPTADIVRALASRDERVWSFGTGRAFFGSLQENVLQNWFYGFSLNEGLLKQWYWSSARVPVSRREWSRLYEKGVTPKQQMALGEAAMKACLATDDCAPSAIRDGKIPKNGLGFLIPKFAKDARDREIPFIRGISRELFEF